MSTLHPVPLPFLPNPENICNSKSLKKKKGKKVLWKVTDHHHVMFKVVSEPEYCGYQMQLEEVQLILITALF